MNEKQDSYCRDMIDRGIVPALSVTFVSLEKDWTGVYGITDKTIEQVNTENTLFDMASLTKAMATTTAVLRMVDEGKLHYEDPVTLFLKDYHGSATIRQCLTHSTGYGAGQIDYRYMNGEELQKAVMNHPVREDKVNHVLYSDVNYILLGFVLDVITGSFKDYINVMFEELGMRDTRFLPDSLHAFCAYEITEDDGLIKGRVHDGKAYRLGGAAGHAGLFSTIGDINLFLHRMLNEDEHLFSKARFEELKQIQIFDPVGPRTYGWAIRSERTTFPKQAGRTIFHTGFTGNMLYLDFDRKIAVGVLTNRIHPDRKDMRIYKELHGLYCLAYDWKEQP